MGAKGLSEDLAAGLLFFTSSLFASLILYLWSRPPRKEVGVGIAAAALCGMLLGLPGPIYAKPMVFGAYWVVCVFVYVLCGAFVSKYHLSRLPTLISMIVPPVLTLGTLPLLRVISLLTPSTLDFYLYAFDGSYGFQPGFVVGRIVQGNDVLRIGAEACYVNLPAAMTIVYCLQRKCNPAAAQRFFVTVALLAAAGCVGYLCFPAVGSVVAFGDRFPDAPPALQQVSRTQSQSVADPRNCIPSLHTAWALIVSIYARRLTGRAGQWCFAAYVGLTLLYTLSCGHYLVDMVVAIPFTAMIHMMVCGAVRRQPVPVLACLGLVSLWLILLRFGVSFYTSSVLAPWSLTVGTAVISALALHSFARKRVESAVDSFTPAIIWKRASL